MAPKGTGRGGNGCRETAVDESRKETADWVIAHRTRLPQPCLFFLAASSSFFFFFSIIIFFFSSSTRRKFYPQRSSGQAVGHRCHHPFSLPVPLLVYFHRMLLTRALALSANQFCARKRPYEYTRGHSANPEAPLAVTHPCDRLCGKCPPY